MNTFKVKPHVVHKITVIMGQCTSHRQLSTVLILDGDTCVHALLQGGLCDSEHMWFQQGSPWTEQTESNISYSDSKTFPKIM